MTIARRWLYLQAAGLVLSLPMQPLDAGARAGGGSRVRAGSTRAPVRHDPEAGSGPHALRFALDAKCSAGRVRGRIPGPHPAGLPARGRRFRRLAPRRFASYHLAVVVDDARQGVTEVVRGADLLSSTPRQILLQRALGLRTPRYGHLLVLTEPDGQKLAKSRRTVPLDAARGAAHSSGRCWNGWGRRRHRNWRARPSARSGRGRYRTGSRSGSRAAASGALPRRGQA